MSLQSTADNRKHKRAHYVFVIQSYPAMIASVPDYQPMRFVQFYNFKA